MAQKKYKRRIYIIDPDFQYRMIGRTCIMGVAIIVMSLLFLAVVHHLYGDVQVGMVKLPDPFASDTASILPPEPVSLLDLIWPVMAVTVGITLIFLFIYVTVLSNRIAGPIYRIRRVLREIADGDISGEVRLRKRDEFKHLAEDINHLKVSLRAKLKEISDITNIDNDSSDCRENITRIKEILLGFKVE